MTTITKQKTTKPRKIAWAILVGIIILIAAIMMVVYWVKNKSERPHRPPVIELPYVEVIPAKLMNHTGKVTAGGFVSAKKTANITPQVSGKILRLSTNLLVGQSIKKGDIIAQIDSTDYRVALSNAQSNEASANAKYLGSLASLASAKATLTNAKSNYEQAQGQSRQAARDVKSLGVKSTRLNLKKPQLAAAKAKIDHAKASVDSAKSNITSAQAAIENAKAQVKLAETNLNRTIITAPFDGIVLASDIAVGEIANNSTLLASLAATDAYTVKLTLDSATMKLISLGNSVTLTDSVYESVYQTTLLRFAPGFDEKNRTIAVYAEIDNPTNGEQPLLLQSYVNAVIEGHAVPNSIQVPNSAIVNNAYLWAKKSDDTITQVAVNVVSRYGDKTLVTLMTPISELITRPKDSFVEGQKVTTNRKATLRKKGRGKGSGKKSPNKPAEKIRSAADNDNKKTSDE